MTPSQLVLCRRIVKGLRMRLGQVKARMRTEVVTNDLLGIGGKNINILMYDAATRVQCFGRVLDCIGTQAFADFLTGVVDGELDEISGPLTDTLKQIAGDAISRHQTPAATWAKMSAAFDTVSKGKASDLAIKVVLAPAPKVPDTVDGDSGEFLPIHEALIIRNPDGKTCRFTPLGLKLAASIAKGESV
jgi:hypothetical protein